MINTDTASYGLGRIVQKQKVHNFLRRSDSVSNTPIDFVFEVNPDIRKLKLQAVTFANNFKAHGYLNLPKILRCYDKDVNKILKETYIYSFVKCYYNALFSGNLDSEDDFGYSFVGHSKLFNLLRKPFYSKLKEEVYISMNIDLCSISDRRLKIAFLLKHFTFLKTFTNYVSGTGVQPFYIPYYEEKLSYLVEDYYARSANGEPAVVANDVNAERNNGTRKVLKDQNDKGKIEIVKVRNDECLKIGDDAHLPLVNAFCDKSHEKFYYIDTNGSYSIRNNAAFFYCIANFICISEKCDVKNIVNDHYNSMKLTTNEDFFVTSEVYTNTGIKCSYSPVQLEKEFKDLVPPELTLDKITEKFKEIPERLGDFVSILESIEDFIAEIEINIKRDREGKEPEGK